MTAAAAEVAHLEGFPGTAAAKVGLERTGARAAREAVRVVTMAELRC